MAATSPTQHEANSLSAAEKGMVQATPSEGEGVSTGQEHGRAYFWARLKGEKCSQVPGVLESIGNICRSSCACHESQAWARLIPVLAGLNVLLVCVPVAWTLNIIRRSELAKGEEISDTHHLIIWACE